jgi:hypothetical protein
MRGLGAWLLTLPLVGTGLFLAHELSYRAAEPHAHDREALLERTGHGYLEYFPVAVALGASLLLVGAALIAARAFRGAASARVCSWPFAVVPALAFAAQEHAERLVHVGEVSLASALEPNFVLGLLLQAPFGLAAFLVARALLAAAERIGSFLAPARRAAPVAVSRPRALSADRLRRPVLALGYAGRAPPRIVVA